MKVLVLTNFRVEHLGEDDLRLRDANKYVPSRGYWFFRYWTGSNVDVLDTGRNPIVDRVEKVTKVHFLQAAKAIIRSDDYDIVVSHSFNSGFVYSLMRSIFGDVSPPHMVIDVGCLNGGRSIDWQVSILRHALETVGGIAFHASIQEGFYRRHFPRLKRLYVPFGVDTEFFRPLPKAAGLDYAISIGYDKRDYETLLRAWKPIEFPLLIVGSSQLPLSKAGPIKVVPRVTINVLRELIHGARFVVLPVTNEPYSVGQTTLLQCMAMARPVITTNVPGVRDYVTNGVDGILVPHGDPGQLNGAIRHLLKDDASAIDLGRRAQAAVRTRNSERLMAERLRGFAEQVLSGRETNP
jgi:glycosyltransferase involved in cell wall biosynthesis